MRAEKNPTTPRVIPIIQQLENATMSSKTDDASISCIKQSLINSLHRRFQFLLSSQLHIVATVLDPNFKLDFTESKKSEERLFSFEKSLCYRTIFEYFEEKIPLQHVQVIDLNTEMPTKKIKLSDFSIKSTKQRTDWRTCLAQYLETPAINGANHFDFWNKTELDESFKNLIFQILAIPSSSGAVERLFSQCNLRCSDRKNRIKPQTLENLVLIATFQ